MAGKFADIGDKLDEAQEGSAGSSDYEELPRVKLTPTAAIGGTIVDVGFTGDMRATNNIRGADDWRDEGDFVFTVKDPEVVRGQLFQALGRDEAEDNLIKNTDESIYPFSSGRTNGPTRDFRIVDAAVDDAGHIGELVESIDGEYTPVGIEILGTDYPGEAVDSFDDALDEYEKVEVFVSGQAGRIMMNSLDVTLGASAYITEDNEKTVGLCEYPQPYGTPDWNPSDDGYPRVARMTGPKLHSDIEGEDVVLFKHFGDALDDEDEDDEESDDDSGGSNYRKHFGDVLVVRDGETYTITQDQPDWLEPEFDRVEEGEMWLEYHEPEDGYGSDDSGSSTSTSSSSDSRFDALDSGGDSDDTSSEDLADYSDLDATVQDFIDDAVGHAAANEVTDMDDAFDADFETVIENAVEGGDIPSTDTESVVAVANERLTGV